MPGQRTISDAEYSNYTPDSSLSSLPYPNNEANQGQKINQGKWSQGQKLKFACFLMFYQEIFLSPNLRKHHRIFKKISLFLKTRKPRQCRSHYQKLTKRFRDFKELRRHYTAQYGNEGFEKEYMIITSQFQALPKVEEESPTSSYDLPNQVGVQTDFAPFVRQVPYGFWGQIPYFNHWGSMQGIVTNITLPKQEESSDKSQQVEEHISSNVKYG